jgi:hypothetical protein
MNTLTFEANASKVWFDKENMWVALTDGRQLSIPLLYFPPAIFRLNIKQLFLQTYYHITQFFTLHQPSIHLFIFR